MATPQTVICTYRVRPGNEDDFRRLLGRHWPALRQLGLVTESPPQQFRGTEADGQLFFVEIFDWANEEAVAVAHEHPQVMAIWEPMDTLTESRAGRPNMEFPHVDRLPDLAGA